MPRRKKDRAEPEVTAYPRSTSEAFGSIPPPPESGLSIAPEEIGSCFLSNAVEETSSEWPIPTDLEIGGGEDWSDPEAEFSAIYELDPASWERMTTRSLRIGKLTSEYPPPPKRTRRRAREPDELPSQAWDEVDLTAEAIHEASLFDHEGDESGEIETPPLRTDDTHSHARRRGGHIPSRKRRAD